MATWHQLRGADMQGLYAKPAKGHKVVVNKLHELAYAVHFSRILEGKLGSELSALEQSRALLLFCHRYTRDHTPPFAKQPWKDGKPYPVQFDSDEEWLANTRFAVTKAGRLDSAVRYCHSEPTWPDNPELRKAFAIIGSKRIGEETL